MSRFIDGIIFSANLYFALTPGSIWIRWLCGFVAALTLLVEILRAMGKMP
jgi:hypothetical protein